MAFNNGAAFKRHLGIMAFGAFAATTGAHAATTLVTSSSQIDIQWDYTDSNQTEFDIFRKVGATGTYSQIGTTNASDLNYTDYSVSASTTYCYKVQAANSSTVSAFSNEVCATTAASPTPSPSPTSTASPSPSPSVIPSVSPSPSPTTSTSPSPAPSPTVSPAPSATPTVNPSPSPTVTSTAGISLFTTQAPTTLSNTDGATVNYELGMRFKSSAAGQITAIRFYKSPSETGTHTGKIYSATGTVLAKVTFSGETASGWQTQKLAAPISITSGTEYVVSVNTGNTYYVATTSGLATAVTNGSLSSIVGSNGVYGPVGSKPASSYQNSNYFRDVVFTVGTADSTAPVLSGGAPTGTLAAGTTSTTIRVTTNENATCKYSTTAGVAYGSMASTFGTTGGLSHSSAITGLTNGVTKQYYVRCKDAAGNVNTTDYSIRFSVASAVSQSVFTTQAPATLNNTDGATVNYELGMRFKSSAAGQITAIRFYKSPSETGTHTGKIYSATGTVLAKVTFSGETASGWQTQKLAAPISITSGTEYVVSVNTGNTYYVATTSGLATAVTNGSLSSIVGSNGVYGPVGSKPASSYQNSNYFRDIVFTPQTGPLL